MPLLIWPNLSKKHLTQFKRQYFFFFATVKLQQFSFVFETNLVKIFTDMLGLNRNEKNTCDNCGTQTTKRNIVRHKTRCPVGTVYCTQCPNFSTTSQVDLNYHIAKKHATFRVEITRKCKICSKEFSGFYASRKHKTSEHAIYIKYPESDVNNLLEDDDADLKEELQACQPFLVDSELEKGRNCFFHFAMSNFDNSLLNKKID